MASPTLGRRGGLKALREMPMPSEPEVEREWRQLSDKSIIRACERSVEDKWRLVCESNFLAGLSAQDYARYVSQVAKKPLQHELGVYGGLAGHEIEWLEECVVVGGVLKPLGKLLREATGEAGIQIRDCVQSLYLMCGFDAGILGLGRDVKTLGALAKAIEVLGTRDESRVTGLQVLTAVVLKSDEGYERVTELMESEGGLESNLEMLEAGGDSAMHSLMLLQAVLARRGAVRGRLVGALERGGLAVRLAGLGESSDDPELAALVAVFQQRHPEFAHRSHSVLLSSLDEELRYTRAYPLLGHLLSSLASLGNDARVWQTLASLVRLAAHTPREGESDAAINAWFSQVLLAALSARQVAPSRDNRLEALSSQLEVANARMANCQHCRDAVPGGEEFKINPTVRMRSIRVGARPESDSESDEWVDIDLDGVRVQSRSAMPEREKERDRSDSVAATPEGETQEKKETQDKKETQEKKETPPSKLGRRKSKSKVLDDLRDELQRSTDIPADEAEALKQLLKLSSDDSGK